MGPLTKFLGWLYFAAFQIVAFVLAVFIGSWLIAGLAFAKCYTVRESYYYSGRQILAWRGGWLTFPWGNEEDGIDGLRGGSPDQFWWRDRTLGMPRWMQIWLWSAFRNSTNNLRFLVKWIGGPIKEWTTGSHLYRIGWNSNGFPVLERVT